jgi:hypothetical protein
LTVAGRLSNCQYCRFLLVLMTVLLVGTILGMSGVWSPLPQLAGWWDRLTVLAEPAPSWTARLGGSPDLVAATPGYVVTASYGTVTGYRQSNGEAVWSYDAYWALAGGDVVVIRQKPKNRNQSNDSGYSVLEPGNGAVLWGDPKAIAVWVFADRILDLVCPDAGDCQLRARIPRDAGRTVWTVSLPAAARTLKGPAPGLVGLRDPAEWFANAANGAPGELPGVIGLRVDASIQIIDTVAGRRVREAASFDQQVRMTIAGERVLVARSERANWGCRFSFEGHDYRTDASVWRVPDLDLGTGSGSACGQREDPVGAGNRIVATRPDNHPVLISATDGTILWDGVPGEALLATDGQLAVVLGADRKTVRVIDLLAPRSAPMWSRGLGLDPQAGISRDWVIIRDSDGERVLVLTRRVVSGTTLSVAKELKTRASVAAVGANGLVLSSGRRIGYVSL